MNIQKEPLLIITCFVLQSLVVSCSYSDSESNTKRSNDNVTNNSQTYIIGNERKVKIFSKQLGSIGEACKPIDEGDALCAAGRYKEAEQKYLLSLDLLHKYGFDDPFQQWISRRKLEDVYEKLNEYPKAFEQIDWLTKHCQNEKTTQELMARKQALEKLLAEKKSK